MGGTAWIGRAERDVPGRVEPGGPRPGSLAGHAEGDRDEH